MTSTLSGIGAYQYRDALADPKGWQPEPGIVIRPFHGTWPGQPDLFHVYCERCEGYGYCGTEFDAREEALLHGRGHERGSDSNG